MKILVTNPPWDGCRAGSRWPSKSEFRGYIPYPVHLAGGAAALREAGHDVVFLDAVARRMRMAQVPQYIAQVKEIKPDLIIQEISTPSIHEDKVIAEQLARIAPLAVSGPHATTLAYQMQGAWPFLYAVLQGEIERNSVQLAATMKRGVYGFDSAKNLDDYPDQWRQDLYLYRDVPGPHGGVTYQTWASRGCPWACKFCIEPWADTGKKNWRLKSPERVVQECIDAHREFPKLDGVYLDGPTENVRDDRCLELAERFRQAGLPFAMMTRVDTLELSTWGAMVNGGLYYVKAGMESANQKLVDDCGKKLDLARVTETVNFLKQYLPPRNIHLTTMYGLPGETKETVRETLKFLYGLGVHWQESYCAPVPGTGYWNDSEFPVIELAMAGKSAPGNPEVANWVKQCKEELAA